MSTPHASGDNAETPVPRRSLPERPSLEQLRKQAKDLLRDARSGDASALTRLQAIGRGGGGYVRPALVRPVELSSGRRFRLRDGTDAQTDDVFAMFVAARDGDLATVARLIARAPALATVEYNYTPPIHFAVREGHVRVVELLLDHGADPAYRSYPFRESLLTFAEERGHEDVAQLLRRQLSRRFALAAGTQAILAGAESGDLAAVATELARDALLAAGAKVDAVRGDRYRPVHCALMPNWFFQEPLGARDDCRVAARSRCAVHDVHRCPAR